MLSKPLALLEHWCGVQTLQRIMRGLMGTVKGADNNATLQYMTLALPKANIEAPVWGAQRAQFNHRQKCMADCASHEDILDQLLSAAPTTRIIGCDFFYAQHDTLVKRVSSLPSGADVEVGGDETGCVEQSEQAGSIEATKEGSSVEENVPPARMRSSPRRRSERTVARAACKASTSADDEAFDPASEEAHNEETDDDDSDAAPKAAPPKRRRSKKEDPSLVYLLYEHVLALHAVRLTLHLLLGVP